MFYEYKYVDMSHNLMKKIYLVLLVTLITVLATTSLFAQQYKFYVAAESEDKVFRIAFDSENESSVIENVISVGEYPTENEGPHGLGVDPGGGYWYVSLGHGTPFGHLYKYEIGTDRKLSRVELGMFPATLDVSAATQNYAHTPVRCQSVRPPSQDSS